MPTLPRYSEAPGSAAVWPSSRLAAEEENPAFLLRCRRLRGERLAPGRRPREDAALLTVLVAKTGVVAMTLPDLDGGCCPVFTSTPRALDYVRSFRLEAPELQLLSISAEATPQLIAELESGSVRWCVIDPCPHCAELDAVDTHSLTSADDVLELWAGATARSEARIDLHLEQAIALARQARLEEARRLALDAAVHITLEDARLHVVLGELATALGEPGLLAEARSFLVYLNDAARSARLDRAERRGFADFSDP